MLYHLRYKNLLAVLPKVVYEFTFIMIIVFSIYLYYSEKINDILISILAVFALASFRIIPSLNVLSSSYQKLNLALALDVLLKEFNSNDVLNKKENS